MQYSVLYFSLFPFVYRDNLIGTIKSAAVQSGLLGQLRPIYFIMTAFDELGPLSNKVLFTVNFRLCLISWSLRRKQSMLLNTNVFTDELTSSPYVLTATLSQTLKDTSAFFVYFIFSPLSQ